ncbi:MAG: hypothetical protein HKN56_01435 [Gammaproteobacteria bacterium]|nr:hypothetical protein [Gammaproteobacteria bacterium]
MIATRLYAESVFDQVVSDIALQPQAHRTVISDDRKDAAAEESCRLISRGQGESQWCAGEAFNASSPGSDVIKGARPGDQLIAKADRRQGFYTSRMVVSARIAPILNEPGDGQLCECCNHVPTYK